MAGNPPLEQNFATVWPVQCSGSSSPRIGRVGGLVPSLTVSTAEPQMQVQVVYLGEQGNTCEESETGHRGKFIRCMLMSGLLLWINEAQCLWDLLKDNVECTFEVSLQGMRIGHLFMHLHLLPLN